MTAPRILVTGGAGFLGSHLCDRLVREGAEVICLDNFFTGSRENIAELLTRPNFELIRHDVVEPILLEVDAIYNLACPSSPEKYRKNPVKTVKTSVMGAIHMLGMAKRVGARVVQASSAEVYGNQEEFPQTEEHRGYVNTIGPRSCHDEGKRVAETLMMDYHAQNRVDVGIARIFNTFGPRMAVDDGRVVSNFIVRALKNEPLTVYGNGAQTRSFCFVSDLVDGLVRLMGKKGFTGPVNLGRPEEVSIRDLAEKIIALTGSGSKIQQAALPENDPVRRLPDISLAREALSWEPHVTLEDGLKQTITYFETVLSST